MTIMIPISVRYRGRVYFFPRPLRGREVGEAEGIAIWERVVPEYYEHGDRKRLNRKRFERAQCPPPPVAPPPRPSVLVVRVGRRRP